MAIKKGFVFVPMNTLVGIISIGFFAILFWPKLNFADEYSFRRTNWGMSIEEVKESEPLEVIKEDNNLIGYKTNVIGKDLLLAYFFVDNQLVRARYVLAESYRNKNNFIDDYKAFKEILTKKYGNPKEDKTIWLNDLYRDKYSDWGMAISIGHLVFFSTWETKHTEIQNVLMGENYEISCIIEYTSKNLKELEKKAQEKKAMDAF